MTIDIEPTALAIDQAANAYRKAADEMQQLAIRMRDKQDISYAADAITIGLSAVQNARFDLLLTRPLREFERDRGSIALDAPKPANSSELQEEEMQFAKFIARKYPDGTEDWACGRCRPNSDMIQPEFICVAHRAMDALAQARQNSGEGSKT